MKAKEIIARSILLHPSLFRESLIKQAEMHDNYAQLSTDARARQGAEAQRNACLKAYDAVGREDADAIVSEIGPMVVALNVAAKLQCLPPHVRTAAAIEWDELNQ
jgi:hypothetical protein